MQMPTRMRWLVTAVVAVTTHYHAHAAPCAGLNDTILTSKDCPSDCGSAPCVFYAPSTKCSANDRAGDCYVANDTLVPTLADKCDVEYQCLRNVVVSQKQQFAVMSGTEANGEYSVAPFTSIQNIEYDSSATGVQILGSARNNKGKFKEIKLDDSVFQTPKGVDMFIANNIDMRHYLADRELRKTWKIVIFSNANLDQVPAAWSKLGSVESIDLSNNYLTTFPDEKNATFNAFKSLTRLNLSGNDLSEFNAQYPALTSLDLSFNPKINKIPDIVFSFSTITDLYMQGCNLTNVLLTPDQLTRLSQMHAFDVSATVTNCPTGYGDRDLLGSKVCVKGATSTESKSGSSHTLAIALGSAAGVLVLCGIGFFLYRRSKNKDDDYYIDSVGKPGDHTYGSATDTFGSSSIWNDPDLLAVRIEYKDIELVKLLARGGFGEVWLGQYMNESVAVKRLLSDKKTMTDALAFAAEIKVMARMEHPKIVRFIGVAWTNALTIQAVTEFMDCGDLKSLLDSSRAQSLTWANLKCQIAIDVADALVYMHTLNPKLIHRDLKSRNVLIDAHSGAKLSDFGISRNRSVEETMTAGVGTSRWIAPEVILGGHYTEFADVYSFGVVLSELDTCKTPYHDAVNTNGAKMQDVTILQLVSAGKLRPTFSSSCPSSIVALAEACLSFDPVDRPSAIHISYELRKIQRDEL